MEKHKLTNLQRLGISALLINIRDGLGDISIEKGGMIRTKTMNNCIIVIFNGYNEKRYEITLQLDEFIDDEYEYIARYDPQSHMFRIIDLKESEIQA